jgi:hypothetical protein
MHKDMISMIRDGIVYKYTIRGQKEQRHEIVHKASWCIHVLRNSIYGFLDKSLANVYINSFIFALNEDIVKRAFGSSSEGCQ